MRLRRPFGEPAWVSRLLTPPRIERGLAVGAVVLLAGAVIGIALGLLRELQLDRVPNWLCLVGLAVLGVAAGRGLVSVLREEVRTRWRLTPQEARLRLPVTVLLFWIAGGFATYREPWDWALSALTAVLVAVIVVPYVLERLTWRHGEPKAG